MFGGVLFLAKVDLRLNCNLQVGPENVFVKKIEGLGGWVIPISYSICLNWARTLSLSSYFVIWTQTVLLWTRLGAYFVIGPDGGRGGVLKKWPESISCIMLCLVEKQCPR